MNTNKPLHYLFILCLVYSALAAADNGAIVKCIHADGTVVYTNQKCESGKAEKVKLRSGSAVSSAVSAEFAFAAAQSHVEVSGEGVVVKLLADDKAGGRHQRFILKLPSGQTLLVAHNVDLASRIDTLQQGDVIQFYGEYLWNEQGGLLHWTHRDPKGKHPEGWLLHNGKRYQ
jgi:hypothetical protein